jgi:tricorn protease
MSTMAVLVTAALMVPLPAAAQIDARMLREPDVSATHISFVYAGDIWLVEKQGGTARRLSSPPGEESFPRFSPDGTRLAYTANYDGNDDLYVVPATGGPATRLTYHPDDDRMLDWTPDGERILFASSRTSGSQRFNQLWTIPPTGGMPERLPLAYGEFAAFAPDGRRIAFQTLTRDFRTWKRYRGGMAPDIWLVDLEAKTSRNLTDDDANDAQPMWAGDTLYFLSDRGPEVRANLWAVDVTSGEMRRVTDFTDFDVRFPAIGPDDLVFEAGGVLYRLELATEDIVQVPVTVVTDQSTLRPRQERVADLIQGAGISPSGKRAVFAARGDLFTVPAEHGPVRNLTHSSGVAERWPTWSPDGRWIAAWTDRSGEYELELRAADGSGDVETLTSLGAGVRYQPQWSPDSQRIAFVDHAQRLWVLDVDTGDLVQADRFVWAQSHPSLSAFRVSWSSDSRWMAWSRATETRNSAVFLFDTTTGDTHQVTSAFYDDMSPEFDADGDYLFVLTNRHYQPSYSDFDRTWVYANATRIAAIALRDDVASPLAPRSDDEEIEGDEEEETSDDDSNGNGDENGGGEEKNGGDAEPEPVEIDLDSLESRLVLLPPEAGNYGQLGSVSGKLLFVRNPRTGAGENGSALMLWSFEDREEETVLEGVDGFGVSADGKKILVMAGGQWGIVDPAPGQSIKSPMRTADMVAPLDPRAEWRQLFDDVWRFQRDYFYDPNMHGIDWEAQRAKYRPLIDHCVTRWDVNFVIGELIGELNASHAYRGGGDVEQAPERGVGLLGVDWELADGAYRIARVVRAAPWETDVRSPLDEPGVDLDAGDFVLAVNGVPVDPSRSPHAAFDGLAGETVVLLVNDGPTTDGAREVLVETLRSENRLRNLEWIETNRRKVEEATDGRVGYVFVPDTGIRGQNELVRQAYAQNTVPGLIVDERFNGGGQWPDRFVELLDRNRHGYVRSRYGKDPWLSAMSRTGPTVMLVNSWAGSGGDAFPYVFRQADVGPIIGTRTWGGLIGISGGIQLVDGGYVTVPTAALYTTDGDWMLENRGLEPDIEVIDDPALMMDGGDPQLERAIEESLRLLEASPPAEPNPPPYEDRSGAGRG